MSEPTFLELIRTKVDSIGAMPAEELSDAELRALRDRLQVRCAELRRLELRVVASIDSRPAALAAMGYHSTRQFLMDRCRMSRAEATKLVARARRLRARSRRQRPRAG